MWSEVAGKLSGLEGLRDITNLPNAAHALGPSVRFAWRRVFLKCTPLLIGALLSSCPLPTSPPHTVQPWQHGPRWVPFSLGSVQFVHDPPLGWDLGREAEPLGQWWLLLDTARGHLTL